MILESFFFGIGSLILIKLVWEDYTKKHKINQSNSAFMLGVVASMYVFNGLYILFFLFMIIIPLIFKLRGRLNKGWWKKNLCIGEGDTLILTWIIAGTIILNPILPLIFTLTWLITNLITQQHYTNYAGTPTILISLATTWLIQIII